MYVQSILNRTLTKSIEVVKMAFSNCFINSWAGYVFFGNHTRGKQKGVTFLLLLLVVVLGTEQSVIIKSVLSDKSTIISLIPGHIVFLWQSYPWEGRNR